MKTNNKISNVPTNIITGFLGSGKTTAIFHLLKSKPANERWAVLVNEFGQIGIDGSLFSGQYAEDQGIFISEVPGGCMCCSANLPMQVALNKLLSSVRPHRLLIEPTGLGHPKEVLGVLAGESYQGVLSIEKIITLVDARNLFDERYINHETFNQQIAIADIIVGNKSDLYQDTERSALMEYASKQGAPYAEHLFAEQGGVELSWLQGATQSIKTSSHHHHHSHEEQHAFIAEIPIPQSGYIKAQNQLDGFKSIGWRFASNQVFERKKLLVFLSELRVDRIKAVFITDCGCVSYNSTMDSATETAIEKCIESRVEIIATNIDSRWEQRLLECLITVNH